MTTLTFLLSELFPLDGFKCNCMSASSVECPFVYYHNTLQLRPTGLVDWLRTRMTILTFILFKLSSLDGYGYNALYYEYHYEYFHETKQFCRRDRDKVSCIKNMEALVSRVHTSQPPDPPSPRPPKKKKKRKTNPGFGFFVNIHLLESTKLDL